MNKFSNSGSTGVSTIATAFIKTDKTERFTTAFEAQAEAQGYYRHFLNRTFCNGVGGRTTGLQTHS